MTSADVVSHPGNIVFSLLLLFLLGDIQAETGMSDGVAENIASSLVDDVRRYGRRMSKAEAWKLEQALKAGPDDLTTRAKLLGYYFYQGIEQEGKTETIKARRRHITWLIRHHAESPLGGGGGGIDLSLGAPPGGQNWL